MDPFKLKTTLVRHEGLRLKPYLDTVGKITIGIGRNLDDNGITENEAYYLLSHDISNATTNAQNVFPNFDSFSEDRQIAIVDMMFNLGLNGFLRFKKMIEYINKERWDLAAVEALDSKWATQVGKRASEIALMLKVG